jgi:aryl-alcohol dehydrogenase-like predicted oxidoreductase
MQYRRLGRSELMVAEVGIGTASLAEAEPDVALETLGAAIEAGANIVEVDTTDERALDLVARAIERRRSQVLLVGLGSGERGSVVEALRRLGSERFDVYLLEDDAGEGFHEGASEGGVGNPAAGLGGAFAGGYGEMAPVEAMGLEGLARSVGLATSLMPAALAAILQGSVDVVQIPLNVIELAEPRGVDAVLNAAQAADVGVLACSPLAGGRLGEHGEPGLLSSLAFLEQGEPRSVAQGAIAWALSEARIASAVTGPRTLAHAFEALEASRIAPLAPDVLERVAAALAGRRS